MIKHMTRTRLAWRPWLRRLSLRLSLIILLFCSVLIGCQRQLVYHPQRYAADYAQQLPKGVQLITYDNGGPQVAYYVPPKRGALTSVWLTCSGNGGVALDWLLFIDGYQQPGEGFLLIDYPSYGACAGEPSPSAILTNCQTAADELERTLALSEPPQWRALGHSLGAASVLQFAASRPCDRIVLISPFTTMRAMARSRIGWPLCLLLRHNFDNLARVAEIKQQVPRPQMSIMHGTADEVVPIRMGRELAAMHPDWIRYHEIADATHNEIVFDEQAEIFTMMSGKD
jgi:uncharacterized protein